MPDGPECGRVGPDGNPEIPSTPTPHTPSLQGIEEAGRAVASGSIPPTAANQRANRPTAPTRSGKDNGGVGTDGESIHANPPRIFLKNSPPEVSRTSTPVREETEASGEGARGELAPTARLPPEPSQNPGSWCAERGVPIIHPPKPAPHLAHREPRRRGKPMPAALCPLPRPSQELAD